MIFPSISIAIRVPASGTKIKVAKVRPKAKNIFLRFDTSLVGGISTTLSFLVVKALIIGGWIRGTRAMYEYAAIVITGNRCGASTLAV